MTDKHVASVIIIGDEVLRGDVQDANTSYLAKSLQRVGIKIQRVVVIPDEIDTIAKEVAAASSTFPLVFTSGGVGPTHDDVTYEGVAKGLELSLKEDKSLLECLNKLFPDKPESRRLATVPYPCELVHVTALDRKETYAVIKAKNVYILPGSPRYFRPAADAIISKLEPGEKIHHDSLDVRADEFALVRTLDEIAKRYKGQVSIGSYPQSDEKDPKTVITFESNSKLDITRAKKQILDMLKSQLNGDVKIFDGTKFGAEDAEKVNQSANDRKYVRHALDVLEQCYDRYKPNEVFLSFNGGKDCTVILHLVAALTHLRKIDPPVCLYVVGKDDFPEVDAFVESASNYYGFELVQKEGPIRQALETILRDRPALKACLLGTRRGDPGAHSLDVFAPTDKNWPNLMRVSPIIDWSYSEVWQFLIEHKVPYCKLYDEGYTSLGARATTLKNPLLKDPNDPSNYLPAHTLMDDSTERHGRA